MFQLYLLLRLKNFGRIVIELGIFRIVFLTILTVAAIMILFLAENRFVIPVVCVLLLASYHNYRKDKEFLHTLTSHLPVFLIKEYTLITLPFAGMEMIKGYSHKPMGTVVLGTHLGNFSKEDSLKYVEAIKYAVRNGIYSIDGAINYRGMCSERDEGVALAELMNSGIITREEVFISSKAGLLYGDISAKLPPMKYLSEKLENKGISIEDFSEYEGLFQTLNPAFYEIALNKSLENLGLEMIDVYYIHIPEITKLKLTEDEFYEKMEMLIRWYETKCFEGKIRYYGIAFEFMVEEPFENKWHIEIERIKNIARKVSGEKNHFKYILFEYNIMCDWADTVKSQMIDGVKMTMIEACKALELETVASMPFAMGDGFKKYALSDMLDFVSKKMNHVIVGSKNPKHIEEILRCWRGNLSECSGRQRFSGTGLVEIAKRNNVSKRTIYRYKAYYEEMKEAESEK